MSKKATWADVEKGDRVELGGRTWDVVKAKTRGKKTRVVVEYKGRRAETTLKASERVMIAKKGEGTKRGPLYDESGTAQRWATKREAREVLPEPKGLPPGDPAQTKPPKKADGDPWETQADRIEKRLDDLLQARLVGETRDENAGYYVPPVDASTVAAHLTLFHGGIPAACEGEGAMLAAHTAQHDEVKRGIPLAVNHWHTAKRP